MPRVHFWPRLVAGVVDYLLATLLAIALIWPFLGKPDRLRLDVAGLLISRCDTKGPLPAVLRDQIGGQPFISHEVCETSPLGRSNGKTASLVYGGLYRDGQPTPMQSVSVAVSDELTPVTPLMPQTVATLLLLIFGGGLMIRHSGQSPGKYILGLKVTGTLPVRGILREAIKLLPILLLASLTLIPPQIHHDPWLYPGYAAAALPPLGWFYILPLLQGGAMRHDRWLGLSVVQV